MDRGLVICPYCDTVNIEGADECVECEQPLSDLHLPVPASIVEQALLRDRVQVLNPRKPITTSLHTPVRDVLKLLADNAVGAVIIVDDDLPVGIFTERDVLRRLGSDAKHHGREPIARYMTAPMETLAQDTKIAFAVQQMDQGEFRHLPIVNAEGQLTGIISVRDILRYLTERMSQASPQS